MTASEVKFYSIYAHPDHGAEVSPLVGILLLLLPFVLLAGVFAVSWPFFRRAYWRSGTRRDRWKANAVFFGGLLVWAGVVLLVTKSVE